MSLYSLICSENISLQCAVQWHQHSSSLGRLRWPSFSYGSPSSLPSAPPPSLRETLAVTQPPEGGGRRLELQWESKIYTVYITCWECCSRCSNACPCSERYCWECCVKGKRGGEGRMEGAKGSEEGELEEEEGHWSLPGNDECWCHWITRCELLLCWSYSEGFLRIIANTGCSTRLHYTIFPHCSVVTQEELEYRLLDQLRRCCWHLRPSSGRRWPWR